LPGTSAQLIYIFRNYDDNVLNPLNSFCTRTVVMNIT
jgi:hypothetical protein